MLCVGCAGQVRGGVPHEPVNTLVSQSVDYDDFIRYFLSGDNAVIGEDLRPVNDPSEKISVRLEWDFRPLGTPRAALTFAIYAIALTWCACYLHAYW